jgi:peptidoglycan/xylan/chitin deacetylase (PgdA/CDA1 family)
LPKPPTQIFSQKTPGANQQDIDLRWNNMDNGCLRAFFFDGDCVDGMGVENGSPTDITYKPTTRYWPQGLMLRGLAADFNATSSMVNIGSEADIDDLLEFTVAFWTYCRGVGGGGGGRIYYKGSNIDLQVGYEGPYVGLQGKVRCETTDALSLKKSCLEKYEWHHVAFTYSDSGDRKVHIFVDGAEVSGYDSQVAGVGDRRSDAAANAFIGDFGSGTRVYDGLISTFLLYDRILSSAELKWLAHDHYQGAGGDLRVSMWEKWGQLDTAKVAHGMVCFQFDDGHASQYTLGKPVFDSLGAVANIAMISDRIGDSGRLSASQLQDFIASGWEIVSHSKTHADPAGLTEGELRGEFADSKAALEALGCSVRHYAWPYGAPQGKYRQICAEYYESAANGDMFNRPTINLFSLGHITIDDPAYLATYKGHVDTAYTNNRLLVLIMHDVDSSDANTLSELIQYVQGKGMPIVTRSQAVANLLCTPPNPLYNATSLRCENVSAAAQQLYQTKTMTAEGYVLSFLAYTDGSPVTSAEVVPFADTAFVNEITDFHYEPVGGGVYLCRGEFTATAGSWNVGVEVKANKTVYVSLPTCGAAGSSQASGPYPRSLIVNETTGEVSREADSLTTAGSANFEPSRGTLDIQFYPLHPSNLSSSYAFYLAHFYGGDGQMRLYKNGANQLTFRIQANGRDESVVGSISWNRGDRVKIRVLWDCGETLDGTNYMLMYGKVNDGDWSQIGAGAAQTTALSPEQTLYVGRAGDSVGYEANAFISWLRIYDRPLPNPEW